MPADDVFANETIVGGVHTDPVIQARDLSFSFGTGEARTQVLFDNSFDIGTGEIVIITGPSGSGKTTLLTLIGALRHMQQGGLRVLGCELANMDRAEQVALRKQIGFIFQHHNLFGSLTAIENVRMATGVAPTTVTDMNRRSTTMLSELGLADRLNYPPARLSGGQRQRVAIARALVNVPALVLADEPTAALDPVSGDRVMALFRQLAAGPRRTTVLIVTHDNRLINMADRIVNMVGGRIISNVLTSESIRICKALAQCEELAGLSDWTLTRLADRMSIEHRRSGETIVVEATSGDRLYFVGAGQAQATKGGVPTRQLSVGDYFGEISEIFHQPIPETVHSLADLELYTIVKHDYEYVMQTDKSFEERVRLDYMSRQ